MTFSRLTLGEPRLKSKLRGGSVDVADPCNEPLNYGTNVFDDPGVEAHISTSEGGGPNGDEIPESIPREWSDGSSAPFTNFFADFNSLSTPERRWSVSTLNPFAGTYHLRSQGAAVIVGTGHAAPGDAVYAVNFDWCDNPTFEWAWTTKIEPGDYVRVACQGSTSSITGGPHLWVGIITYDASGSFVNDFSDHAALSTSYTTFQQDGVATSGSKYIQVYFGISTDTSSWDETTEFVDIDAIEVEVQP